jgi:hypothetical protein
MRAQTVPRASTGMIQDKRLKHLAHPVMQVSTLTPGRMRAQTVPRASTGWLRDEPLKHRARPAARASTGLLQDKPMRLPARPAARASTGLLQDKPLEDRPRPAARACQPGLFDLRRADQMVVEWKFSTMAFGAQSATTAGEPKKQL